MRRVYGLVASGLGAFLIVVGLLTHFFVAGKAIKYPLGEYQVTTLAGNNVSYFSLSQLQEISAATVTATSTIRGDVAAGTANTAVWDEFTYIYDHTDHQVVSYSRDRFAFDRHNGQLTKCCGASVGTNTNVPMSGLGTEFPINAQKTTYQLFDTVLRHPVSASFVGQTTIDGLTTYEYAATVQPTAVGTQSVPGSLVGSTATSVTLTEYYQDTKHIWIDPITGTPMAVNEYEHLALRDSGGAERLVLYSGDLNTTPASTQDLVNTASGKDTFATSLTTIVPITAGIIGLILLVVGIIVARSARDEDYEYVEE